LKKITDERLHRQAPPDENRDQTRKIHKVNGNGSAGPILSSPAVRAALRVALQYPVFPCDGVTKEPLVKRGFYAATQDAAQITKWWQSYPQALIGVPTGPASGLLAIDCDPKSGDWYTQHKDRLGEYRLHQTRRGKHLIYSYPEGSAIGISKSSDTIDVRGKGGYIIWWAAHGGASAGEPGDAPPWAVKLCQTLAGSKSSSANGHAPPKGEFVEVREGGRDDYLSGQAYALVKAHWGEEKILKQLRALNAHYCKPPLTDKEVERIARGKRKLIDSGRALTLQEVEALSFDSFAAIGKKTVKAKRPILGEWLTPGAWLVVGRPKMGKSWLLLQMMLALAKGRKFLDFAPHFEGCEMLALCAEDDDGRIKGRVRKLGGMVDPARTHVINRERLLQLAKEYSERATFGEFLRLWLQAHPQTRLVVIDTEASARLIWGTRALPQAGYQSITEVDYKQTAEYDQLALETGCVILLVNHTSKMTGKRGQIVDVHELVNRSNMALAGASGSWVLLEMPGSDPNDTNIRQRRMGMRGRDLEEDVDLVVSRAPGSPAFVSEGAYVEVVQSQVEIEILKELLAQMEGKEGHEYVTSADIAHGLGKPHAGVKKAVGRMVANGRVRWNGYRITTRPGVGMRLDKLANNAK
jgi:hypothetical protein